MPEENTQPDPDLQTEAEPSASTTWGPKLFYGAAIAALVFFWWMVIYPHGVAPHH